MARALRRALMPALVGLLMFASAALGSGSTLSLGASPGSPVADGRTGTVYVPLQCRKANDCGPTAERFLAVIDIRTCRGGPSSACRVVARARAGLSPLAAVVDPASDTVYSLNGDGTVTVIDGGRCNARAFTGCGRPRATVVTGGLPVAGALDPGTGTLYLASPAGQVLAVDVRRCNARSVSGCRSPVRRVADRRSPDAIGVDPVSHAVYVADVATGTVSIFDGSRCDGQVARGCRVTRTVRVGVAPWWLAVDAATRTVYVADHAGGTVAVLDARRCDPRGCSGVAARAATGRGTSFLVDDPSRHTLFALNAGDETISALDTHTCNGRALSGCRGRAPNEQVASGARRGAGPSAFALAPAAGEVYLVDVGGGTDLQAASVAGCSALKHVSCRAEAPSYGLSAGTMITDPASRTLYVADRRADQIDVLDGRTCAPTTPLGCSPVARIPTHGRVVLGALESGTDTLYAGDTSGEIDVIDAAACNARVTAACTVRGTIHAPGSAGAPVVSRGTLYFRDGSRGAQVAVLGTAACNALQPAGCSAPPVQVPVPPGDGPLLPDPSTGTIYIASGPGVAPGTVALIDGTTCNALDRAGCGRTVGVATVGAGAAGMGLLPARGTLYVSDDAGALAPGRLTLLDTTTCNRLSQSGCGSPHPSVAVGRDPRGVAVDPANGAVYVASAGDAAVTVLAGSVCSAAAQKQCGIYPVAVGSGPMAIAYDSVARTVFVADEQAPGALSLFAAL